MIFLKHFNISEQTLKGVSKVYVQRNSKVSDLVGTINALMSWQSSTPLRLYEVSTILDPSVKSPLTDYRTLKGNQTRHDRAHEAEDDLRTKRNPRWRRYLLPG